MQPARYKTFPPRWRHLRLPLDSRSAALATLAMWSPCRPRALALQQLGWTAIRLLGARALPGAVGSWAPPWDGATGVRLQERWQEAVGGDIDGHGIYQRTQGAREGFALLLLRRGRPVAFAKIRPSDGPAIHPALRHEHEVLARVRDAVPIAFTAPAPLGLGAVAGWSYVVTAAMPGGLDRPAATGDAEPILADISRCLADLPRPEGTPPGWEPMHGDLTPWNLRVRRGGGVVLVDWEDARWGPPGADAVLLHTSRRALFGAPLPHLPREAAAFWLAEIEARPADPMDDGLRRGVTAALRQVMAHDV